MLDRLAAQYPDWGWYFLYTREAHPGERQGPHRSTDDKLAAARRLRDEIGISRPILVDDLAGTVHRAYGTMPNMTWVLGRRGVILYKAQWTVADRVRVFLDRLKERPLDATHIPFHTEQIEVRERDESFFLHALERNGPRAATEYRRALDFWTEQAREARRNR